MEFLKEQTAKHRKTKLSVILDDRADDVRRINNSVSHDVSLKACWSQLVEKAKKESIKVVRSVVFCKPCMILSALYSFQLICI